MYGYFSSRAPPWSVRYETSCLNENLFQFTEKLKHHQFPIPVLVTVWIYRLNRKESAVGKLESWWGRRHHFVFGSLHSWCWLAPRGTNSPWYSSLDCHPILSSKWECYWAAPHQACPGHTLQPAQVALVCSVCSCTWAASSVPPPGKSTGLLVFTGLSWNYMGLGLNSTFSTGYVILDKTLNTLWIK